MAKLYLQRHLKSQWNVENRFAGWVDNPLSEEGILQGQVAAEKLKNESFDIIYTSPLSRNKQTVLRILRLLEGKYPIFQYCEGKMKDWGSFEGPENHIPVIVAEELNERYYGKLQGLNKEEVKKTFGEDQVHLWRRSYDVAPPEGESLKDTFFRVIPFFEKNIEKDLKNGKDVLIVSSGNALRSIVKKIENISDKEIINFEIDFGGTIKYEFDGKDYKKLQ
jgi:2,3-bisphosphoglycerate-dependent phosphoglycerate mutase